MPKGPRGEKRPADAIGRAVMVAKIATGEIEDERDEKLASAAAELGRKGGKARAVQLNRSSVEEAEYFAFYNFCRIHKTLRISPAMAAGITDRLWSLEDIVSKIDEMAPTPKSRGPYKKRSPKSRLVKGEVCGYADQRIPEKPSKAHFFREWGAN